MENWYLTTAKFDKQAEDGSIKRTTESFLIKAITFGNAEEKAFKKLEENKSFNPSVNGMKIESYSAVVYSQEQDDTFYKAKVSYLSTDDKKIKVPFLVEAESLTQADERLKQFLRDNEYHNFEILNMSLSAINEVIE